MSPLTAPPLNSTVVSIVPAVALKPPTDWTCTGWLPSSSPPLTVIVVGVMAPLPFKLSVPPELTSGPVIVQAPVTLANPPLKV